HLSTSTAYVRLLHTLSAVISTLSLHDALPISERLRGDGRLPIPTWILPASGCPNRREVKRPRRRPADRIFGGHGQARRRHFGGQDRKSTRLNSSHFGISYAVFCLKKKKDKNQR